MGPRENGLPDERQLQIDDSCLQGETGDSLLFRWRGMFIARA